MIYAFLTGDGLLAIEADDEEGAVAALIDNGLIGSTDEVGSGCMAMGNVIRVRGPTLEITGEEELLG